MEDRVENKKNISLKIIEIFKKEKKIILITLFSIILIITGIFLLNYHNNELNKKTSEKYIKAGLLLSSENKEESKNIYKEIVLGKNSFYSLLALNEIVENNLEPDSNKVLELFIAIENIKNNKEQKNLIQLKKGLYLMKISKQEEGKKILKKLIEINSIWKEAALEILN